MQLAAAAFTASAVMVAPETASTSADWAFRMASAIWPPILPPMSGVSPETSIFTSVILVLSKVMVTFTSLPMPRAVAS